MQTMYIEEPDDPELTLAWEQLRQREANLSGWQYKGSSWSHGQWTHFFKNRGLAEKAETEEDHEDAVQEIPASAAWQPSVR